MFASMQDDHRLGSEDSRTHGEFGTSHLPAFTTSLTACVVVRVPAQQVTRSDGGVMQSRCMHYDSHDSHEVCLQLQCSLARLQHAPAKLDSHP